MQDVVDVERVAASVTRRRQRQQRFDGTIIFPRRIDLHDLLFGIAAGREFAAEDAGWVRAAHPSGAERRKLSILRWHKRGLPRNTSSRAEGPLIRPSATFSPEKEEKGRQTPALLPGSPADVSGLERVIASPALPRIGRLHTVTETPNMSNRHSFG
jgi:hypothetical protein